MVMNLSEKILTLRHDKGYTQERLAEILDVSTAAVSKWECNNAFPDITLLPKIAEIFGISIDYLFGYDITQQKSLSTVIAEANQLRKELKCDEAATLIAQTLARYPNNMQLMFELARHKYINTSYKKKTERDKLMTEASELFSYVADNTSNEKHRAWSLHFLTLIKISQHDYEKASKYNAKLLGVKGLYPRVTQAIIEMQQQPDENAYHLVVDTLYSCIFEYSIMVSWIAPYLFGKGDNEEIIWEYTRAAKVFEEFVDCGWIYNNLSCCYETVALAYANTDNYDACIEYLEKACDCAIQYDEQDINLTYNAYEIPSDVMESEEKISSCKLMLQTLNSRERSAYDSIRDTERYTAIISKLKTQTSV